MHITISRNRQEKETRGNRKEKDFGVWLQEQLGSFIICVRVCVFFKMGKR